MRPGHASRRWLVPVFVTVAVAVAAGARPGGGALPPGRQHRLNIDGEAVVSFLPVVGLDPVKIEYRARVEYLVDTRTIDGGLAVKKAVRKVKKKGGGDEPVAAGAVDVAVHSAELRVTQNGNPVVETRTSRSRFQGRFRGDGPLLNVAYNEAPPALQDVLKRFDVNAATVLIDDRANVIGRRVRIEGPLHAVVATLVSIHTPIPTDVAFWEAPTQLAMGQGQTARGSLRFEKEKSGGDGPIRVKVSGVLKAEGAVAGRLTKDGTYTVTGAQSYDPSTREWESARWSVAVDTELGNDEGLTVARSRGTMTVLSEALSPATTPAPGEGN